MRRLVFRAVTALKLGLLCLSAFLSLRDASPLPILIVALGLLCLHSFGIGIALQAGRERGYRPARCVLLCLAFGPLFWLLAPK